MIRQTINGRPLHPELVEHAQRGHVRRLGERDRAMVDDYLDSVREIERRVELLEQRDLSKLDPEFRRRSSKAQRRAAAHNFELARQTPASAAPATSTDESPASSASASE